jgi:hypothetical protein
MLSWGDEIWEFPTGRPSDRERIAFLADEAGESLANTPIPKGIDPDKVKLIFEERLVPAARIAKFFQVKERERPDKHARDSLKRFAAQTIALRDGGQVAQFHQTIGTIITQEANRDLHEAWASAVAMAKIVGLEKPVENPVEVSDWPGWCREWERIRSYCLEAANHRLRPIKEVNRELVDKIDNHFGTGRKDWMQVLKHAYAKSWLEGTVIRLDNNSNSNDWEKAKKQLANLYRNTRKAPRKR